jgi:glycosyltransferase involved in cell wall biosynthesis
VPEKPLVSIITPSYNQAAFLEYTIRSVLEQEYAPIEYLIVDGASKDHSVEIIQRFASRLAWWVSEPDSGQAEAINKGLLRARGDIVAWLNSDDLYLPGAITQAVAALQAEPALGMVFADAITINAQGQPLNRLSFGDWSLEELMAFRIICQPALFMRRSLLEKAGFLDPTYHFMLDHHLWIRIARLAPIRYAVNRLTQAPSETEHPLWAAARQHAHAKNVAQATDFGRETLRLLQWIQSQPDLASQYMRTRRHVLAGAYRLNARYLLDGGMAWAALQSYSKAMLNWPGYTLKHWHRMAYAVLCLLKVNSLADRLRAALEIRQRCRLIAELQHSQPTQQKLDNWPGLHLTLDT